MSRHRTRKPNNSHCFITPTVPSPPLLCIQSALCHGVVSVTSHHKTAGRSLLSCHVEVAATLLYGTAKCQSPPEPLNCQLQINSEESEFHVVIRFRCFASKIRDRLYGKRGGYLPVCLQKARPSASNRLLHALRS